MLLVDLFGGGPEAQGRIEASSRRLKGLAEAEGLPMGSRDRTYNSRLAQELGAWAAEQGKGSAFHDAVFRAYFVDAKNIGDEDVLLDLAVATGLDRSAAKRVLQDRTHSAAVERDWARSREAGITGVPTFEAGGRRVVGAQPYDVLRAMVEQAGAEPRKPSGR